MLTSLCFAHITQSVIIAIIYKVIVGISIAIITVWKCRLQLTRPYVVNHFTDHYSQYPLNEASVICLDPLDKSHPRSPRFPALSQPTSVSHQPRSVIMCLVSDSPYNHLLFPARSLCVSSCHCATLGAVWECGHCEVSTVNTLPSSVSIVLVHCLMWQFSEES